MTRRQEKTLFWFIGAAVLILVVGIALVIRQQNQIADMAARMDQLQRKLEAKAAALEDGK